MKKYSFVFFGVFIFINLSFGIILGSYGSKLDDQSKELDAQISKALDVDAKIKEKNEKLFEFIKSKNAEFEAISDAAGFIIREGSWGIFLGFMMAIINILLGGSFILWRMVESKRHSYCKEQSQP